MTGSTVQCSAAAADAALRFYRRAIGESEPTGGARNSSLGFARAVLLDGIGPEQLHERWRAQREASGWKYGKERDDEAKLHPAMVPFSHLVESQRQKNYIFVRICRVMSASLADAETISTALVQ
jgi:hypothetical protein